MRARLPGLTRMRSGVAVFITNNGFNYVRRTASHVLINADEIRADDGNRTDRGGPEECEGGKERRPRERKQKRCGQARRGQCKADVDRHEGKRRKTCGEGLPGIPAEERKMRTARVTRVAFIGDADLI